MKPWGRSWLLAAVVAVAGCGRAPQEPAATEAAVPGTTLSYIEREGRALYHHYCATCHGAGGEGDGFNAYNLDPKPRDLTSPELQASRSDGEITAVIRHGGGAAGLSTGMPPWGRVLGERQIGYLVRYLRRLPQVADEDS